MTSKNERYARSVEKDPSIKDFLWENRCPWMTRIDFKWDHFIACVRLHLNRRNKQWLRRSDGSLSNIYFIAHSSASLNLWSLTSARTPCVVFLSPPPFASNVLRFAFDSIMTMLFSLIAKRQRVPWTAGQPIMTQRGTTAHLNNDEKIFKSFGQFAESHCWRRERPMCQAAHKRIFVDVKKRRLLIRMSVFVFLSLSPPLL